MPPLDRRRFIEQGFAAVGASLLLGEAAQRLETTASADEPVASPQLDAAATLLSRQRRQIAAQRRVFETLNSRESIERYQREVRRRFVEVLGEWPERTPLEPRVVGRLQRDGYSIEKLVLQSQPGFYVPTNLYLPASDAPAPPQPSTAKAVVKRPAVLCPLGHAPTGKAHASSASSNANSNAGADDYQALFVALVRRGYVVCAYDPLGQGEREPYGEKTGNHHHVQGYHCLPSGRHLAQYFIWDGMRCLDYLVTRPEVDAKRIGCTGCSGGGALTQYLAALDERIAAAATASWIAPSHLLIADRGLHVESWFAGLAEPTGPGTVQLLACIAPRPLLVLGNHDDAEFPPEPMQRTYAESRTIYERLGVAERASYVDVPTPHGFWPAARREVYRFFARHLPPAGATEADIERAAAQLDEAPFERESVATLNCAPHGQVRNLPRAKTVYQLNLEVMKQLTAARAERRRTLAPAAYREFVIDGLRKSLCWDVAEADDEDRRRDEQRRSEKSKQAETQASTGREKQAPRARRVLLVADDETERATWSAELTRLGIQVRAPSLLRASDREELMTGLPRVAWWARQILGVAGLADSFGVDGPARDGGTAAAPATKPAAITAAETAATPAMAEPIWLAVGPAASYAVQAAALLGPRSPRQVIAVRGLDALERACSGPDVYHSLLAWPGAWRWLDETDLAAALAGVNLWLAAPRSAAGDRMSESEWRQRYAWSSDRHAQAGSRLRLEFALPTPAEVARATE